MFRFPRNEKSACGEFDQPRARSSRQQSAEARRIEALQSKLLRKDEVLAELMEEHVAFKKSLGEA